MVSVYHLIAQKNFDHFAGAKSYANFNPRRQRIGEWKPSIHAIDYDKPFHRTTVGEDHTYFVIDLDPTLVNGRNPSDPIRFRDMKIAVGFHFLKTWLEEHPEYDFFVKLSGSGFHLIQRHNESINPMRFEPVIKKIFKKCSKVPSIQKDVQEKPHLCSYKCNGWHHPYEWVEHEKTWKPQKKLWSRYVEAFGRTFRLDIDLKMFEPVHLVRWTYSRNMKVPERANFAIPIMEWDLRWILKHMYREHLQVYDYSIPEFQFEQHLIPEKEVPKLVEMKSKKIYHEGTTDYRLAIPEPDEKLTDEQKLTIQKMDTLLTSDETVVPPCVSKWYIRCKNESKIYWGRYVWVRWLANKGYSPEEIGLLMRFNVNDERDNLPQNKNTLHEQLPQVYGPRENPYPMMGCSKLQLHGEPTSMDIKIATKEMCSACNRTYPMQDYRKQTAVGDEDVGFQRIQEMCYDVLKSNENKVLKKSTRAGVTTSVIPMAKMQGKRLLVVVPTNRIGKKTFVKAVKLSKTKFDTEINGAMFTANRDSCLRLIIIEKDLEEIKKNSTDPSWSDKPLAWKTLRYHSKPSCEQCKFKDQRFNIPIIEDGIPKPLITSDIDGPFKGKEETEGTCAYITLYHQIQNIDVVFITYSKLFALFANDSKHSLKFREDFLNCFDVVLLDEVSHLTNQQSLSIQFLSKNMDEYRSKIDKKRDYDFDFLSRLEDDISKVSDYDTKSAQQMVELGNRFKEEYMDLYLNPLTIEDGKVTKIKENFLTEEEKLELEENFKAMHELIEKMARQENKSVRCMEDLLFLLGQDNWMISSIPTKFKEIDIKFVTQPATQPIKRFIREFNAIGKQVVITDATLPFVNMADFFEIPFNDFVIGDPRGTNKSQLIIADSRSRSVIDLLAANKHDVRQELMDYINLICEHHDPENVMVVTPNKISTETLRAWQNNKNIPKDLMITYYRSDLTIGVESDRRIMIMITRPQPPDGSHDWLAFYFHLEGLHLDMDISELGNKLADTSAKIAFYQAIGRAKDPEVKEGSVIYCWGISGERKRIWDNEEPTVLDLMDFDDDVPTPEVLAPSPVDARTERVIKAGKIWQKTVNDKDSKPVKVDKLSIRIAALVKKHINVNEKIKLSELVQRIGYKNPEVRVHFSKEENCRSIEYLGIRVIKTYSKTKRDNKILSFERMW